jgi:hypothetical protein
VCPRGSTDLILPSPSGMRIPSPPGEVRPDVLPPLLPPPGRGGQVAGTLPPLPSALLTRPIPAPEYLRRGDCLLSAGSPGLRLSSSG